MNYFLKSGILHNKIQDKRGSALASIKNHLTGPGKSIEVEGEQFSTDIQNGLKPEEQRKGICFKKYVLKSSKGDILLSGIPQYAEGEDPAVVGWPIYRMPHINSADLLLQNKSCRLQMINSQNYLLSDALGNPLLKILHRGFVGGWDIEASAEFHLEIICGVFVFCRYLELENELMII